MRLPVSWLEKRTAHAWDAHQVFPTENIQKINLKHGLTLLTLAASEQEFLPIDMPKIPPSGIANWN